MFTVKHCDTAGARFFQTANVYHETGYDLDGKIVGPKTVSFHDLAGNFNLFSQGSIFVMNEGGKTIEQYHFYCGPEVVKAQAAPSEPLKSAA